MEGAAEGEENLGDGDAEGAAAGGEEAAMAAAAAAAAALVCAEEIWRWTCCSPLSSLYGRRATRPLGARRNAEEEEEEDSAAVSGAAGGSSGKEEAKGAGAAEADTERACGDCEAEPLPPCRCVGVLAPCWECGDESNMQRDGQQGASSLAAYELHTAAASVREDDSTNEAAEPCQRQPQAPFTACDAAAAGRELAAAASSLITARAEDRQNVRRPVHVERDAEER